MKRSMPLSRKRILSYGILTVVFIISMSYLILPSQLKLFYVIDDAHRAEAEPQGTWPNMTCPQCGSQLEQIVIVPPKPQTVDTPWRYAYYCRHEEEFWVADMPGLYFAGWYGPFDAHWRLTNTVATSILIISGATLVLLAIKQLKKSKISQVS